MPKTVMLGELIVSASAEVVEVHGNRSEEGMAYRVTLDTPFDSGSGRIVVSITEERAQALGLVEVEVPEAPAEA